MITEISGDVRPEACASEPAGANFSSFIVADESANLFPTPIKANFEIRSFGRLAESVLVAKPPLAEYKTHPAYSMHGSSRFPIQA
ncbi:MAG TPA: hypothetical protein VGW39_13065 [Chthoniobacterales bacterium]|nr:hypothetical protein [Chthoniobacterales bacterium]